jgi:tRNA(fMet)-specific endonuclease VapC
MGRLIDASILIAAERGKLDLRQELVARQATGVRISVITASEILHGIARATDPTTRTRRAAFVEQLLIDFPVLDIDLETAKVHALLWVNLQRAGTIIGQHDLWLAASALRHGLLVVTANESEFKRVPNLQVENWLTAKP